MSSLTDAQVAPYADNYFQYASQQRVTEEVAAGDVDSQTSGGLGTYTFRYTASSNNPNVNHWTTKTVVGNPDGSIDTVYTNAYAEVMLDDHYNPASGVHTLEAYVYTARPSPRPPRSNIAPSAAAASSPTTATSGTPARRKCSSRRTTLR